MNHATQNQRGSILPRQKHKPKGLRYSSAVIFARAGAGKTYLLTTFRNCISIDLEGGTRMIETTAVEPRTWAELDGVLKALETEEHAFDTVSIDTADRAYDICCDSVCRELGVQTVGEAARGKGWELLKIRWRNFVYRVINLTAVDGRKLMPVFLCHEKVVPMTERRNGTPVETGRSMVSINMQNTGKNNLLPAVDFVFHLFIDETDGRRYLRTQATDTPEFRIEAKGRGTPGRCLPPIIPADFPTLVREFDNAFGEGKETK